MTARRILEQQAAVLAVGALGMAGFVGTLALTLGGWLAERAFWIGALLSLAIYGVSLVLGHLGGKLALRRLGADVEQALMDSLRRGSPDTRPEAREHGR